MRWLRMPAMSFPEKPPEQRGLAWAIAASLAIHALALFVPRHDPAGGGGGLPRLEARLAPRQSSEADVVPPLPKPEPAVASRKSNKARARSRMMTTTKPGGPSVAAAPKWTAAEKAEMDGFLNELAAQPKPTLAQRSVAMARQYGQQMARQDAAGEATLEMRPNGPPADPFSLEMYLDALVRRLNRSAGFVRNDPRSRGVHSAAVQFRLNPDGSLKSFVVLNAADQADEIAFIKSVIERSVPFSPFPPDIDKAARSLGVTICIRPGAGDAGMGFSRTDGRGC